MPGKTVSTIKQSLKSKPVAAIAGGIAGGAVGVAAAATKLYTSMVDDSGLTLTTPKAITTMFRKYLILGMLHSTAIYTTSAVYWSLVPRAVADPTSYVAIGGMCAALPYAALGLTVGNAPLKRVFLTWALLASTTMASLGVGAYLMRDKYGEEHKEGRESRRIYASLAMGYASMISAMILYNRWGTPFAGR
jgi:hypothetical protein